MSVASMSVLRRIRALVLAMLLAVPMAASAAQGDPKFPDLTGDVVDDAHVLSDGTKAVLTRELATLRHTTGHRLVVVTVSSLQGREIADYGIRLFRDWQVGRAGSDDGAILLIAPHERSDRIEVGYRLEPVLTDAASSVILRDLRPRLAAGDYDGAALLGERAIVSLISAPAAQAAPPKPSMELDTPIWVWVILAGFAALLLGAAWLVIWAIRAAIRAARGARETARMARERAHGAPPFMSAGLSAAAMQEAFDARWNSMQEEFEQRRAEQMARFEAMRAAPHASGDGTAAAGAAAVEAAQVEAAEAASNTASSIPEEPFITTHASDGDPTQWGGGLAGFPPPPEPAAWPEPPTPAAAPDDSSAYTGGSAGGGGADDKW